MNTQEHDPRYDFVRCSACGREWQNIDFGCAVHHLVCKEVSTAERHPPVIRK